MHGLRRDTPWPSASAAAGGVNRGMVQMRAPAVVAAAILVATGMVAACSPASDPSATARAFAAAVAKDDRSIRVDVTGHLSAPFGVQFSAGYDLVGADFVGSSVISSEGMALEQGLAGIDDHTFTRYGDGGWGLDDRRFARPDPFAGVGSEDIEVIGTDRRDDRDVVHLRVKAADAALGVIALYGSHFLTTTRVERFEFDLYVSVDGAPISADVAVSGSVTGELAGPVAGVFALQFSGFGATALEPPFTLATFPPGTAFVADNGYDEPIILRDAAGFELLVPACSRITDDAFDGSTIYARFAGDDQPILSTESAPGRPQRYILVAIDGAHGEDLPYIEATKAPCTGRSG